MALNRASGFLSRLITGSLVFSLVLYFSFVLTSVPRDTAAKSAVLLVAAALPLAIAWLAFRQDHKPTGATVMEALTVGSAISIALQLVVNIFTTTVGWGQAPWIVSFLISLAVSVIFLWRTPLHNRLVTPSLSSYIAIAATLPLFLLTRVVDIYRSPILEQVPFDRIPRDMYLFEAMGNAIARFGPGESGLQLGQSFRYHWFSYAWSSWFSDQIGAGPLVVLARVTPLLCVLLLIGIASALTAHFFKQTWAPTVVGISLLVGTSLDYYTGKSINFISASHTLGAVWLLLLMLVITVAWNSINWKLSVPLIILLSAVTMGSKLSHGTVLVAGTAFLFAVHSYRKRRVDRRYLLLFLLTLLPAVAVYLAYQSGQPSGGGLGDNGSLLTLDGTSALYGLIVAVGVTLCARLIRWFGLAYALTNTKTREWDITWIAVGAVSISFLIAPILRSDGGTEQWFLESANIIAIPVATLAVIWFATHLANSRRRNPNRPLFFMAVSSIVIALIFVAIFKSPFNEQRPYLPYLLTLASITIVSLLAIHFLRESGTRLEIFTGTAATIGLLLSLLVANFITVTDIREGALTAERPVAYFDWAKDQVFESDDQEFKNAAYQAAMWLRANADPKTDVLEVDFPTQAWMGALSNLRLVDSFPELVKQWSVGDPDPPIGNPKDQEQIKVSLDLPLSQLQLTCESDKSWILSLSRGPVLDQNGPLILTMQQSACP
jgi:uncharacterized membrane protein